MSQFHHFQISYYVMPENVKIDPNFAFFFANFDKFQQVKTFTQYLKFKPRQQFVRFHQHLFGKSDSPCIFCLPLTRPVEALAEKWDMAKKKEMWHKINTVCRKELHSHSQGIICNPSLTLPQLLTQLFNLKTPY